jgi:hypothetical protein
MVLGVLVGQGARGARQPAVGERVPERFGADLPQLDEDGAIPIEVRDREKGVVRVRGEDGFLVVQVRSAHGEDRSLGRGLLAEPLQVGLAERAFPRERFASDGPGPMTVAVCVFALCDLGQCGAELRR